MQDSDNNHTPSIETSPFNPLAELRKKLLDLTARNSLLNYRHPKKSCIRIIDELPDLMVNRLQSEQAFTFLSIPAPSDNELLEQGYLAIDPESGKINKQKQRPTARQWAKHLGFHYHYDFAAPEIVNEEKIQHNDKHLQSLLYAWELEARLHHIRRDSSTALEESGAGILFLGIGFLEWYESEHSDRKRMAPLYTLPVDLERSKKVSQHGKLTYALTLKDEPLITNITLKEKLAHDFGLSLPSIEEDTLPEAYFQQIEATILPHQPRWRVRRQATLLLLNFTKQAMYEDLDPNNWPADAPLQDHPIIAKFFGTNQSSPATNNALSYEEEHLIDDIADIHHSFPLIYDADSSQHSALIDAVDGENLVIEGPPGSGKSQTITNLIAAAIANGKKVLFVAEKMAALNVVKDRLDKANLGTFCLELHSHKSNKVTVINALRNRIEQQKSFRYPTEINADIERFEDLKQKLSDYVMLINTTWANTELTIHDILNKATRYREQLSMNPDSLKIEGIDGDNFSQLKQKELFDHADNLKSIYQQTAQQAAQGNIAHHFWYGVTHTHLISYQADQLQQQLQQWTDALLALQQHIHTLNTSLEFELELDVDVDYKESISLSLIEQINTHIAQLPALKNHEPLAEIGYITDHLDSFEQWLKIYATVHHTHQTLNESVHPAIILAASSIDVLDQAHESFTRLGLADQQTLADLSLLTQSLNNSQAIVSKIKEEFERITPTLSSELARCFTPSVQGFREFQILVSLINELPSALWRYRDALYDNPDLDALLAKMTLKLNALKPLQQKLEPHFHLHDLAAPQTLKRYENTLDEAGFFKWFSGNWRQARQAILSLSIQTKQDTKTLFSLLPTLIQYAEGIKQLEQLHQANPALKNVYVGIETPIQRITEIRRWYKKVRAEYGIGFGERFAIGNALLTLDKNHARAISDIAKQYLSDHIDKEITHASHYAASCRGFMPLQDQQQALLPALQTLSSDLERPLLTLDTIIKTSSTTLDALQPLNSQLQKQQALAQQWLNSPITEDLKQVFPFSLSPTQFAKPLFESARDILMVGKMLVIDKVLRTSLLNQPNKERYQALLTAATDINKHLQQCRILHDSFDATGQVQRQAWMEVSDDKLTALIAKNTQALKHPNWLNTWLDYIRLKNKLSAQGLEHIIQQLEAHHIEAEQLSDTVRLCVYHQLANEIFAHESQLAEFSGMEQMAYRNKFQQYDHKLLILQQELIAFKASRVNAPEGISTGRVREYTEVGLIRHNMGLKRPRIALRSLLKRSATAIKALKPCFMMSPMSVAKYLQPGQFNFDLVVMDEASQIRPEDALGAIARGKSLIVVGDPKQLPPTSFFQKVFNNEDNEDRVGLEESESILDSVLPLFKNRRLRWHYRSRHESLIAFSNFHFYDGNLILFPSPLQKSEQFGMRYTPIDEGCFISRRNTHEAKEIIAVLIEHLIQHPNESVGIVSMNAEQSDEIDHQFQAELAHNVLLQKAYEHNQQLDEPLFIKNLENVQGDERDVIMISMTYAPLTAGATTMHQRFGPVNSDVGWRRLNVLLTRSKMRMHIFSSMTSAHINTHATSSRGVIALKKLLAYCETGHIQHYEHTGKAADSDFEIAVMDALAKRGYECEPQLGVTGYFLDIAVKDPVMSGRFLMGIECDGASYHSAKSTRDRDRLRQQVLENLGWTIRRIWSTDWFKNPQAQLEPILQELDSLKTKVIVEQEQEEQNLVLEN